jgi:adenylate kinase family enzyme
MPRMTLTVKPATSESLKRVAVVGATGSGKTRLAGSLAKRLALPHVELDALFWEPGWRPAPRDVFRERVAAALAVPGWVTDGNYHLVRDLIWSQATTLVWLDYPLPFVLWRLAWRTLHQAITGEALWNGNRDRLRTHLLSRNSIFLWALKSHPRHRREYPVLLQRPEYAHLAVVHLRSPRETEQWLTSLD